MGWNRTGEIRTRNSGTVSLSGGLQSATFYELIKILLWSFEYFFTFSKITASFIKENTKYYLETKIEVTVNFRRKLFNNFLIYYLQVK